MAEFNYRIGEISPKKLEVGARGKFIVELDDSSHSPSFVLYALSHQSCRYHEDIVEKLKVEGRIVGGGRFYFERFSDRTTLTLDDFSVGYGGVPYSIAKNLGDLLSQQLGEDVGVNVNTRFGEWIKGYKLLSELGFTMKQHDKDKKRSLKKPFFTFLSRLFT